MESEDLHALRVKLVATWQAHDAAVAVDILFEAYHTFYLAPVVLLSFLGGDDGGFLVLC